MIGMLRAWIGPAAVLCRWGWHDWVDGRRTEWQPSGPGHTIPYGYRERFCWHCTAEQAWKR